MSFLLLAAHMLAAPALPVENTETENRTAARGDERDEVICRRQLIESSRIGERMRSVRVCKTREEWRQRSARR